MDNFTYVNILIISRVINRGRKLIKINNIKGHAHNMLLIVKHEDRGEEILKKKYFVIFI
ncbi:MAG: hypothetical protein J6Z08_04135 [Elusimicrobiales bacterium]|nr:hypothetical protein [Elusimicrobiales bacterium]